MELDKIGLVISAKSCQMQHTWREIGQVVGNSPHTCRVAYYKRPHAAGVSACPVCLRQKTGNGGPATHQFNIRGNYAVAESTDGRIRTLADLCAACQVDLSVWRVRDHSGWEAGTWEAYAANEVKDLSFDEGRITGTVSRDGIIIETLFRVRATFVRREPVPIKPTIQPLQCSYEYKTPAPNVARATGVAGVIADPHYGYLWSPPRWELRPLHDRAVLDLFLQVMAELQPDVVELLGDWFDMAIFQDKFVRRPELYQTTQPAILEGHHYLRSLRHACPAADIRFHKGNHDERIESALLGHVQETCDLKPADAMQLPPSMSVPRLLALDSLGIRWVGDYPDDITMLGESVECQHGAIARGGDLSTVSALLADGRGTHQICGHIHRDEMVSIRLNDGRTVTGYCPGCACHVDGRVPKTRTRIKWRQGFGVLTWSGRHLGIEHVPVWGGQAVWRGKTYTARNTLDELKTTFPDWPW